MVPRDQDYFTEGTAILADGMSYGFMLTIALLYAGATVTFIMEGKYLWAVVALSWGLGNAVLAHISR